MHRLMEIADKMHDEFQCLGLLVFCGCFIGKDMFLVQ